MNHHIRTVSQQFQIPGQFVSAALYGNGHINDTYAAVYQHQGRMKRYIHQRINHQIFKNPIGVMANIARITAHLQQKMRQQPQADVDRRTLTLVPAQDGATYVQDETNNVWRTYLFIEDAQTYNVVATPNQAYAVGKAFGQFQQLLVDFPEPRLIDTIPDFHNTPKRFADLMEAIEADTVNRAKSAQAEIDFAFGQAAMVDHLTKLQATGEIPERVTHNDTKINNVLLDNQTGEGLCVVDLDTVMPGLALYDFGDMVRTATCLAAEDERDLSKVVMEMPLFEALTRGYWTAAGAFLNTTEKDQLAFSGKLITFEIGIRFLADYLAGDTYFKIHRPQHNLDRCRTQFKLVQSISEQEANMTRFVSQLAS